MTNDNRAPIHNFMTPRFRTAFAKDLFVPQESDSGPKFGCTMLFPKGTNLNELMQEVDRVAKQKWPNGLPHGFKHPLKDGDLEKPDWEDFQGHMFARANTKKRPPIYNEMNNGTIESQEEMYSGCYARAVIHVYPYDTKGNKGVALALDMIQKLGDGERIAGSGPDLNAMASQFFGQPAGQMNTGGQQAQYNPPQQNSYNQAHYQAPPQNNYNQAQYQPPQQQNFGGQDIYS